MTTAERLTAVAENVKRVYEAGKAAGGLPDGDMSDPDYVYAVTRPKDWLPMPRPTDYECYCLGQILPGKKEYFSAWVNFAGACVVEFGTVVNGVFVAQESFVPENKTFFTYVLEYDDYGDELADGCRQYMMRFWGERIYSIDFRANSLNAPATNVVDIVCGIATDQFSVGTYNRAKASLGALRYLNFVGKGVPAWINGDAFAGKCNSLLSVGCEALGSSQYATYACYDSRSLIAVSPNLFAGVKKGIGFAFANTRITGVSLGNVQPTINTDNLFQNTPLARYTPETIDLSKVESLCQMFYQCYALVSATGVNISSAKNVTYMFTSCESLNRLTFAGETTPGGWTLDLTSTRLDHDALVEMINSIPSATAAATITITGLPGASELTDAEIAVATAKNWTITR